MREGDIAHWELIWWKQADMYSVVVDAQRGYSVVIIPSRNHKNWRIGSRVSLRALNKPPEAVSGCKVRLLTVDEWPGEVCRIMALRAMGVEEDADV